MINLFWAELRREWIMLKRYGTEAIASIIGITFAFYGIFLITSYVAGPVAQFGNRLDAIVVGYVLWSLAVYIIGDIAGGLQQEAMTGTLEQLFLSPFGASRVFLLRAVAKLTLQLIQNGVILLLIMLLTQSQLSFPPMLILPLITVLLGGYGLALMMGSLALLLKRVQQLLSFLPFGLLFVLTVPIESWTGWSRLWGWLLPMSPGAGLLRTLMAQGEAIALLPLLGAFANGLVYFALGIWLFQRAEQVAKKGGKLSGY